jgi:predicted negative regulator of RcsB-dependent stress response
MDSQAAPSHVGINIRTWIEVHKMRLLYGSGAALVLIIAVSVFLQFQANKEVAASQALSEIRVPFNPATAPPPDAAQKLFDLANQHKGTKAAARALHMSGGLLFVEGDFARAQERFNALIQTYPESPWVPDANLGIAACLEAQGKTDDAIKKYDDIKKRHASATVVDDAKLALARLYEKSNPTESWRLYEELLNADRNSGMAQEAGLRQEELVKRNPELASLRQPPPAPMIPTNKPVQITRMTNRPTLNTNRTLTFTNLVQPTATNTGSAVPGSSPIQIKINPPPAPGTTPQATAPSPIPSPPPAPAPAPPPAK